MLNREHIEKLLVTNGVAPTASDEEIKSVLLSARWHKDDVETAMIVLRENTSTHQSHIDSLHKIFRSDERLKPETVSALLGVSMNVSSANLPRSKGSRRPQLTLLQFLGIFVIASVIAVGMVTLSLWQFEIGPFHQTHR